MSKKETRRAARQAFPKAPSGTKSSKATLRRTGGGRSKGTAGPSLRRPTIKRAAIQGAVIAILYLVVIRLLQSQTSWVSTIVFTLAGFVVYTAVAYAVDRFTYQRRLRKLKGPSK